LELGTVPALDIKNANDGRGNRAEKKFDNNFHLRDRRMDWSDIWTMDMGRQQRPHLHVAFRG